MQGGTSPQGMLKYVTDLLPSDRFQCIRIPWADSFWPVTGWDDMSYQEALTVGTKQGNEAIANVPTDHQLVLLGYSAGAHLAGDLADSHPRVNGCALIADPMRPLLRYPAGAGILGARSVRGCWFWEVANPHDVICCCPVNSVLRGLDFLTELTLVDPPETVVDNVLKEIELVWNDKPHDGWAHAAMGILGYIAPAPWGQHTGYNHMLMEGTGKTYCVWLAEQLIDQDWNATPAI